MAVKSFMTLDPEWKTLVDVIVLKRSNYESDWVEQLLRFSESFQALYLNNVLVKKKLGRSQNKIKS
jgi:hypothetical protein